MNRLANEPGFVDVVVFKVDFDSSKDMLRDWKVNQQSTLIGFKGGNESMRSDRCDRSRRDSQDLPGGAVAAYRRHGPHMGAIIVTRDASSARPRSVSSSHRSASVSASTPTRPGPWRPATMAVAGLTLRLPPLQAVFGHGRVFANDNPGMQAV